MRKFTLLFTAAVVAVAASTAADAAKRKAPAADPGLKAQEQSNMFIRDSMQPWATSLASPAAPKARKAKKKG